MTERLDQHGKDRLWSRPRVNAKPQAGLLREGSACSPEAAGNRSSPIVISALTGCGIARGLHSKRRQAGLDQGGPPVAGQAPGHRSRSAYWSRPRVHSSVGRRSSIRGSACLPVKAPGGRSRSAYSPPRPAGVSPPGQPVPHRPRAGLARRGPPDRPVRSGVKRAERRFSAKQR